MSLFLFMSATSAQSQSEARAKAGASAVANFAFIPFSLAGTHVRVPVTIGGHPAHAIIDTGLNPSGISLPRARELGLPIDAGAVDVKGYGAGSVKASPTIIKNLVVGGVSFPEIEALADDGPIYSAARPGQEFDMILGASFLGTGVFLIDYKLGQFVILPSAAAAAPLTRSCSARSVQPQAQPSAIPRIANFKVGARTGTALVDTGQGAAISIFDKAIQPAIAEAVRAASSDQRTGARGGITIKRFASPVPIGFAAFNLKGADAAVVEGRPQLAGIDFANIGNNFFKAQGMKLLLDYKAQKVTYFGRCT